MKNPFDEQSCGGGGGGGSVSFNTHTHTRAHTHTHTHTHTVSLSFCLSSKTEIQTGKRKRTEYPGTVEQLQNNTHTRGLPFI